MATVLIAATAQAQTTDSQFVQAYTSEWREYKTQHGKPKRGEGHDAWVAFQRQCLNDKRRAAAVLVEGVEVVDGDTIKIKGERNIAELRHARNRKPKMRRRAGEGRGGSR